MVEEIEEVSLVTDQISETPIPRYTDWDNLNLAISKIANGTDEEHPSYGLGEGLLFHGQPFRYKRDGIDFIGLRVVLPSGDIELSYFIKQTSKGEVSVTSEGWCPRQDPNEYAPPIVKESKA